MTTLTPDLILDEPQVAGPLAVFPVLGVPSTLAFRSFAQAVGLGAFVKEHDEGAQVRELVFGNPTDQPVLLLEGEEVLGAQQNRTFDVSILAPAGGHLRVPVSCMEQGRWDGARAAEHFAPAPQTADPAMRRAKRLRTNAVGRADQGEVWDGVVARMAAHSVDSESAAMHDVYEGRRQDLAVLAGAVFPVPDQIGAVATVAGRPVALDVVTCAGVFADLFPRLAQGYALEAIDKHSVAVDRDRVERFVRAATAAPRARAQAPGIGEAFAISTATVSGGGVVHDGELIQLSAFPGEAPPRGRIAKPGRRRPRA